MYDKNNPPLSLADLEPHIGNESLGPEAVKRLDSPCDLHFHSLRHRLADPDGLSAKAVIDGLVLAGIFQDDSAQYIKKITYSQEKIAGDKMEITVVTIEDAKNDL